MVQQVPIDRELIGQGGVQASDFGDGGRLDPANDSINLMTYHSSKGLEFPMGSCRGLMGYEKRSATARVVELSAA